MPGKLWTAFANNWPLLNKLFTWAANIQLKWAKKLGIEIGLFVALHTYSRQLNQHPHIHRSVTRGGLFLKHGVWRPVYFKKKIFERYWRQAVIALLRESYASLDLPAAGYQHIRDYRDYREWYQYLEVQFQRRWKIHFAKKNQHTQQNVNYLGPPIAVSKLRHYTGGAVVHHGLSDTARQEEILWRYITHIPSRHFKMVRYYCFLANRKRGELLPKVYIALGIKMKAKPQRLGFVLLMKQFTNVDPYQCVLCGSWIVFNNAEADIRAEDLLAMRRLEFKIERWVRQVA